MEFTSLSNFSLVMVRGLSGFVATCVSLISSVCIMFCRIYMSKINQIVYIIDVLINNIVIFN